MPGKSKTRSRNAALIVFVLILFSAGHGNLFAEQNETVRIIFDIKPTPESKPVFDWLEKEDICWGIEVPWYTDQSDVRQLRKKGWEVLVHLHANPDILKRHWTYQKRDIPDVDTVLQKHIHAAGGKKEKVNWLMFIEDDSCGVGHSQDILRAKPKTHAQAMHLFDKHVQKAHAIAAPYPELPKWGMCGFASTTHAMASRGLDWLILERANDDVDDLQTGIAFARGAAGQYGCHWGLDLSLWWGVFSGCIQDLPASFHKRHLYLGYFSGAQAFRIEGGDLFWNHHENRLAALAHTVEQFSDFTKRFPADEPDVPFAIMLGPDHGWMTPPYWRIANEAWNYSRMPYRPGDRGIDGFFAHAFPGSNYAMQPFPFGSYEVDDPPASPFSLSCVTPGFAPNPEDARKAAEPIPFGRFTDRKQAKRTMNESSMDPSPYRPMGDSRWGDIFDVLTTEASTEVLKKYEAVILLGQVKLDAKLKERLTHYATHGGTVVCSAGIVGPGDREFTGLKIQPEFRVARAWHWQTQSTVSEPCLYLPSEPTEAGTVVLAKTATGKPLITRYPLGSGHVFTCTVPWYEGPTGQLTGPAMSLMDHVIEPLQPVIVRGLPVEWVSTEGPERRTVVIANHGEDAWKGEVTLRGVLDPSKKCIELLSGRRIPHTINSRDVSLDVEVAPYDLAVFRWE